MTRAVQQDRITEAAEGCRIEAQHEGRGVLARSQIGERIEAAFGEVLRIEELEVSIQQVSRPPRAVESEERAQE